MFYFEPIDSSILMTASLAPPCLGPYKAPAAMATAVYTSTPELEMCLMKEVEQFISCSAWRMKRTSRALTSFGCGL